MGCWESTFQQFCKRGWVPNFFFLFVFEERLDGNKESIFGGGSGFLEIAIMKFISHLLFHLLFMCRLKDVVLIAHLRRKVYKS